MAKVKGGAKNREEDGKGESAGKDTKKEERRVTPLQREWLYVELCCRLGCSFKPVFPF
jgi:hypothetical protein